MADKICADIDAGRVRTFSREEVLKHLGLEPGNPQSRLNRRYGFVFWLEEGLWTAHAPAVSGAYGVGATAVEAKDDLVQALEVLSEYLKKSGENDEGGRVRPSGEVMEDQDEMTEDKAAQEPDPRFLIKVAVAGLALHLAGYAMDNAMAGDAAAVVLFAGWLWGGRAAEGGALRPHAKGPGSKAAKHVMWRLLIGLALFLAAALLGTTGTMKRAPHSAASSARALPVARRQRDGRGWAGAS